MPETLEHRRIRLSAIVKYIPTFVDPAALIGEWFQLSTEPGTISAASFMLHANAERFVADCYAHGWMLKGFD